MALVKPKKKVYQFEALETLQIPKSCTIPVQTADNVGTTATVQIVEKGKATPSDDGAVAELEKKLNEATEANAALQEAVKEKEADVKALQKTVDSQSKEIEKLNKKVK